MKKINFGFISQLLLGLGAVALMIIGAIMFVGHFYQADVSLFQATIFMALGAILFSSVKVYFMFLETLNIAADGIDKISKATETRNESIGRIPQDYFSMAQNLPFKAIAIDDMTPEEIEKLKKDFPDIEFHLEAFSNMEKRMNKKTKEISLNDMNILTLKDELKKAKSA